MYRYAEVLEWSGCIAVVECAELSQVWWRTGICCVRKWKLYTGKTQSLRKDQTQIYRLMMKQVGVCTDEREDGPLAVR